MIDWSQYGIELTYNATTCAKICTEAYTPTLAVYQKLVIILCVMVIGLAVLLLIKGGKKSEQSNP